MATEEDLKKAEDETTEDQVEESEGAEAADKAEKAMIRSKSDAPEPGSPETEPSESEEGAPAAAPMQLGYVRFVYAAYMAFAMLVAFLVAKIAHVTWYRLGQWKPELGEPTDEIIYPIALVVGVLASLYYWKKPSSRQYTNEVAEELSKVTWPNRKEVTSSTFVVIVTTLFATVFFALMDQFWKYVTDHIYSF
jgi:preprotein translocase subunit SecE